MNNVTPERKARVTKSLAVFGFVAIIGVIAWSSVQIVRYAPKAFTSLASIAGSLTEYQNQLDNKDTVAFTSTIEKVDSGKPATLTWKKASLAGSYAFYYSCNEGVVLDIVDTEGLRSITCDTSYGLGDTDTVTVVVNSEKKSEVAVTYTVTFTPDKGLGLTQTASSSVLVSNLSAKENTTVATKNDWRDTVISKPTTTLVVTGTSTPVKTPTKPGSVPAVTPPAKGYIDLITHYTATGVIDGNTFKAGALHKNSEGAVQFTITNMGTMTSATWSYSVTLPSGFNYISPLQSPLLAGEQATISIGFSIDDLTTHTFVITAAEKNDVKLSNNSDTARVTILK